MGEAAFLILVACAAFLLPLLGRRIGVPGVVLEILFGVLLGPGVGNVIAESELLTLLGELGFLLLLFLSGFEIDFNRLRRQGPGQLGTGVLVFALTLAASFAVARLLGQGAFTAFLFATTSLGLVVPTLRGARVADTRLGQTVLIQAVLADFLTLVGVTIFATVVEHGIGLSLLQVPALFAAALCVLLLLRRTAWWFPDRFARLFAADDPEELGIRASLALMLAFVGLAELLQVEPILGAFVAGSLLAYVFRDRGALEHKLTGFAYGFLIPIFFINVGVRFDVALLDPDTLRLAAVLIVAAFAVKLLPSLVFLTRRLTLRESVAAGTLLSARLSLVIAVAELGVRLGLLSRALEAAVILLAIATTILAPTLFRLLIAQPARSTRAGSGNTGPDG